MTGLEIVKLVFGILMGATIIIGFIVGMIMDIVTSKYE